jgi:uncharacterized phage protein gp47/JayE
MAFIRPTLPELVERIQQDFKSRLELESPLLRRALVYVFSRVLAGAAHLLHGHLEYLGKQIFPDQAAREYLLRHAALYGLSLKEATFAQGNATLTGTNGAVVEVGTVLLRADGTEYETDAEVTIAAGAATVAVTAQVAGEDANCDAGTELSFESPVAGVNAVAAVAVGGIASGSDEESIESLRTRLLERMQSPPHGGSAADYIAWAKEVAGVTRAWVYPMELGAGTVVVRFVRDDDASLIPDAGEVAAVQAHIAALRPVTATVTVQAPVAVPLAFTLDITPDNADTRAAVQAELADLLRRTAEPGGSILRSQIEVAVGTAAGVSNFTVTAPAADATRSTGQIATMGTITWT